MGPAPWWVTLVVGVLTVVGAFVAARIGSKPTLEATDQRENAAAREEWFKRFQWASELTLAAGRRRQGGRFRTAEPVGHLQAGRCR